MGQPPGHAMMTGPLHDLVMRGDGLGMPGRTAPGDAMPAPESSSVVGSGIARLLLPGSLGSPPPPINWRQVEDNAEFTCSQVTVAERLLEETLASVGQNILHSIRISLKKEGNVYLSASDFLRVLSFPPVFHSAAPVLR
jgi:hypothetical protein